MFFEKEKYGILSDKKDKEVLCTGFVHFLMPNVYRIARVRSTEQFAGINRTLLNQVDFDKDVRRN